MYQNCIFTSPAQCCANTGEQSMCWSAIHWLWKQWVASSQQVNRSMSIHFWSSKVINTLSSSQKCLFPCWQTTLYLRLWFKNSYSLSSTKQRQHYFWLYPHTPYTMLLCVCLVIDQRWHQNVERTKKVAQEPLDECVSLDVVTAFWQLLWSITKQMYSNMESFYVMETKQMLMESSIHLSSSIVDHK